MRRTAQFIVVSFAAALVAAAAFFPACSSQCSKQEDCSAGQLCYQGTCANALSARSHCTADPDCGSSGDFFCLAGFCTLRAVATSTGSGSPGQDAGAHD